VLLDDAGDFLIAQKLTLFFDRRIGHVRVVSGLKTDEPVEQAESYITDIRN
jgi:hypothetical protein